MESGRYVEGGALLQADAALYQQLANPWTVRRQLWLKGRIALAAGLGMAQRLEPQLRTARIAASRLEPARDVDRRAVHVTEPGDCYLPFIDPAYRDRAPVALTHDVMGAAMSIDNGRSVIPYGMVAAAGRSCSTSGTSAANTRYPR